MHDRIMLVFNTIPPEGQEITGIDCWFSAFTLAHRDFSKISQNHLISCAVGEILEIFLFFYVKEHYSEFFLQFADAIFCRLVKLTSEKLRPVAYYPN